MYTKEMKISEFTAQFEKYGVFTTAMIKTIFGDKRKYLSRQISQWTSENKIIQLKKGLYTFNNPYILEKIHPFRFANKIQEPSYISTYSALEFYNLIPERVSNITSIVATKTTKFTNKISTFSYQKIKSDLFRGYQEIKIGNQTILIATAEKALLDTIYQTPKQSDPINYFRLQHLENIDFNKLKTYGKIFASKKIDKFLYLLQKEKNDGYTKI